jgi:hypothetical protein
MHSEKPFVAAQYGHSPMTLNRVTILNMGPITQPSLSPHYSTERWQHFDIA